MSKLTTNQVQKQKIWKKWWFWVIVIVVFIFLLVVFIVFVANSYNSNKKNTPTPIYLEMLDTTISHDNTGFKIDNNESLNWTSCKLKVNDAYEYYTAEGIEAKGSLIVPFSEFNKEDGTRFNIYETKAKNLYIRCDSGKGGEYRWNEVGW